jgi:hypothetical protein
MSYPRSLALAHGQDRQTVAAAAAGVRRGVDANLAALKRTLEPGSTAFRIDAALSDYRTAGFSIDVHSYTGGFPVVACADILAA